MAYLTCGSPCVAISLVTHHLTGEDGSLHFNGSVLMSISILLCGLWKSDWSIWTAYVISGSVIVYDWIALAKIDRYYLTINFYMLQLASNHLH